MPSRPIVIHYHLFKNAGTSLDHTLRANFGATWDAYEGTGPELDARELSEYLIARPWISALSSHRAVFPTPNIPGLEIISIIFVRHPLDRIRSVYQFERKQAVETPGARAAKEMDMAGYVRWRLSRPGDFTISNFQTHRLARGGRGRNKLEAAISCLGTLPFVGLVEAYPESVQRLQNLLAPHFPKINLTTFHANATERDGTTLQERLIALREQIGEDLYTEIETSNQSDLIVWNAVCDRYEVPILPLLDERVSPAKVAESRQQLCGLPGGVAPPASGTVG